MCICNGITLEASLHQCSRVFQREDVANVVNFAHVHVEELQAGGEGHPEELHLLTLLLGQTLVPQM